MSERLKKIWQKKQYAYTPQEKEKIIKEIVEVVIPLLPEKPKDGRTPTKEELLNLVKQVVPNESYFKQIIKPLIPKPHPKPADGKDGSTPTDEKIVSLIKPLIPKLLEQPPIPSEKKLEEMINSMIKKSLSVIPEVKEGKPTYDQIVGVATPIIEKLLREQKRGWFGGGGGGDLTDAGDGLVMTRNAIGRKIYSVSPTLLPVVIDLTGVTIDLSLASQQGTTFRYTATSNPTFTVINPTDGQSFFLEVLASGANRQISFDSTFGFGMYVTSPVPETVSGKVHSFACKYRSAENKTNLLAEQQTT